MTMRTHVRYPRPRLTQAGLDLLMERALAESERPDFADGFYRGWIACLRALREETTDDGDPRQTATALSSNWRQERAWVVLGAVRAAERKKN